MYDGYNIIVNNDTYVAVTRKLLYTRIYVPTVHA